MTSSDVLIIDSSLSTRVNLQHALMAAGFKVTACESGAAGRRALRKQAFALLVIESTLPDIDGIAIVEEVRRSPSTAKTPVIVISSNCDVTPRLQGLAAGANEYIGKPIGAAYLVKRARQLTNTLTTPKSDASRSHNPLRILIVDDSETFLNAFADRIRAEGHDVVLAKSGAEALSFLDTQPVDGIVLDLFMPGLSGLETCRRIRNARASANVPIMLLTGREDSIARATGLSAGVDDYMVKSTDLTAMAVRLGDVIRTSRKQSAERSSVRPTKAPDTPRTAARLSALLAMAASAGDPESKPRPELRSAEDRDSAPTVPPPPPSSSDSSRGPDTPVSARDTSELFEQVLHVSGLQHMIGRGCLRRAFDRAGVDPRTLTPEGLSRAMPEIKQTLGVFLSKEEAERHAQAISVLLRRAPYSSPGSQPARGSC